MTSDEAAGRKAYKDRLPAIPPAYMGLNARELWLDGWYGARIAEENGELA